MRNLRYVLIVGLYAFSCNRPVPEKYLSKIREKDTLSLTGRFAECGEWGGHHESILIYKSAGELWITYMKDSVSCITDPNRTRKVVVNTSRNITKEEQDLIDDYIRHAIHYGSTDKIKLGYASDIYSIATSDTIVNVIDQTRKWHEFNNLTKDLLVNFRRQKQ